MKLTINRIQKKLVVTKRGSYRIIDIGRPGPSGIKGEDGDSGIGWTPVIATVVDGERRVQRVIDWTGGAGDKPAAGAYIGAAGFVVDIAQAIDIRGAAGAGAAIDLTPINDAIAERVVGAPPPTVANRVCVFTDATGKSIKMSSVVIDDSGNVSGIANLASGTQTITSASANALAVGRLGATNPALSVDASASLSATGLLVQAKAAGAGITIMPSSPNGNESMTITSKGAANIAFGAGAYAAALFQVGGINKLNINTWFCVFDGISPQTTDASAKYAWYSPNEYNSTYANNVEAQNFLWNPSKGFRNHLGGGVVALQREFRYMAAAHSFSTPGAITDAANMSIDGATIAHGNATITNSHALLLPTASVVNGGVVTNAYGLTVEAPSGAANNYSAQFKGSAGTVLRLRTDGKIEILATNIVAGTTGAATIHKPSGRVNFAAGASTLVVTNNLCTVDSLVFAVVQKADATAIIKNVVAAAGSFTINLNAAATAETPVAFFIIN